MVSGLRAYSLKELGELVEGLDAFEWEIGQVQIGKQPAKITFLLGKPRAA